MFMGFLVIIAADLHMEHLNAIAKGCIKNLGANKTETAIKRSAKAYGLLFLFWNRLTKKMMCRMCLDG